MAEMGFQLITVGTDGAFISRGAREAVSSTRKAVGEPAA
jgi:hypothetical protein